MISLEQLQAIIPAAGSRADKWLDPLNAAMEEFEIAATQERQAAFIAQIAHESGGLVYVREIWGPIGAQNRYERNLNAEWPPTPADQRNSLAWQLGNSDPGDGFRYRGRGLIQVTGRGNYAAFADFSGHDFVGQPDLLELPEHATASAGWFWRAHGLNELADAGDFVKITRRINGGINGLADRQAYWERAKLALGV